MNIFDEMLAICMAVGFCSLLLRYNIDAFQDYGNVFYIVNCTTMLIVGAYAFWRINNGYKSLIGKRNS
jgi:hypothetical protein